MASLMPNHDEPHADAHAPAEHHEEEGEICSICLETLPRSPTEFLRLVCCGKGIHEECGNMLNENAVSNCPMCRTPSSTCHDESHKRSLRWAKKGKVWAMFMVGCDFRRGRGVSASMEMARLWYAKAAEKGYSEAQFALGLMYHKEEAPYSMEKARLWYAKAAELGHRMAQHNLGIMHDHGLGGLPVSKEKARVWYAKAAEQGEPGAQYNLGGMHAHGEGGRESAE